MGFEYITACLMQSSFFFWGGGENCLQKEDIEVKYKIHKLS